MAETRNEIIKEFMQICGSDRNQALTYLGAARFSLTRAVDEYLVDSKSPISSTTAATKRSKTHTVESPSSAVSQFFECYKAPSSSECIDPDGIERLSHDLGIETLDPLWIYIAEKCKANEMGFFSRTEWMRGMQAIGCSSLDGLKESLSTVPASLLDDPTKFRDMYSFAFQYTLDEGARNISLATAVSLWTILLPLSNWALSSLWLNFVRQQEIDGRYKAVTKDTWNLVSKFHDEFPDIQSVESFDDAADAWPVLIDEFVADLRSSNLKPDSICDED